MKSNGKALAVRTRQVTKPRYQRPQDWRGTLIHKERTLSTVDVTGWESDATYQGPEKSQLLWSVAIRISHGVAAESVFFDKKSPALQKIVPGTDPVQLEITVGRVRGGEKREDESFTVDCELAHLDMLQQTLTAALAIGRRDGTFPIAKGVKPVRSFSYKN